jgi:type I restriction enzyme R subunit
MGQVAADLVEHFERRQEAMQGKAMVVTMSRRIAVELYDEIVKLKPEWDSSDDAKGKIKIVMTGSASDPLTWQPHIRNKKAREAIAQRFKDPNDELEIVIVRDMWLTGFDVPSLHTMYVDKPMRGHGLMQAIARVNRVFRDKPGGLVVDYLGIGNDLKRALIAYTESGGKGRAVRNVERETNELVAVMLEKLDVCRNLFDEFSYVDFLTGSATEILQIVPKAREYLLLKDFREPGYRKRFDDAATALLKAFALAGATDEAQRIRREVAFFQTVKAAENKTRSGATSNDIDHAVQQLVDQAIAPQGVVDIFAAAGLDKPDISILSEGFLLDVEGMPQKNLAVELLERLLNDEIKSRKITRMVQARLFSDRLGESLNRYNNRSIETAHIIVELIALAREMRSEQEKETSLELTTDELAFYDALGESQSAVEVLGDEQLRTIAREVAQTVRDNASIDWTKREQVRANLRRHVKRVLRKYGYPPDKTDHAAETVIEQAELLAREAA